MPEGGMPLRPSDEASYPKCHHLRPARCMSLSDDVRSAHTQEYPGTSRLLVPNPANFLERRFGGLGE